MKKIILFATVYSIIIISAGAQNRRPTGANFNAASISATPKKVDLSLRSFQSLPSSASLEKYCPTPGDQGNYGTCVAFANGYGVATILYAKTHDITDKTLINKYAFSATYLYEQIKDPKDANCQGGADPINALITMIKGGDALLTTVPYRCGASLTEQSKNEALNYKLRDASILYATTAVMGQDKYDKTEQERIEVTKKALAEGNPVSAGFFLPETFFHISSDVWYTKPEDTLSDWKHAGHAMAVVGYDDAKAGGAFRVLNSWGTNWADKGFVWIRYKDFAQWCAITLQVFANPDTPVPEEKKKDKPEPTPEPKPAPPNIFRLSGHVEFRLNTGETMEATKSSTRNLVVEEDIPEADRKEDLVAYKMTNTYSSGTRFRFYISTDDEVYIYAFATDLTGKVNRILPFDDMVSTHIGANSTVAFPSDSKVIKMDDQKGSDYLLILYSKEKLDAAAIAESMTSVKGGLSKKIKAALGDRLIDKNRIRYDLSKPGFSITGKMKNKNTIKSGDDPEIINGTIVPLMVEITHN